VLIRAAGVSAADGAREWLGRGHYLGRSVRHRGAFDSRGISGAVLLLPFQVGILGTPSPSVTRPTCCTTSSPQPALYRYWRQRQTGGCLALVLIAGTLPGAVAGP